MNGSLLLFSTLALVTVATPGPTTLLALNHGARHGVSAALPGVAGAVRSDAVLIAAVFRRSFSVAVTNPKGTLFFSALLPSFIDPVAPLGPQYALLAAVFAGIDGAVLLGYAAAGAAGALALWRRPAP
jgi:threonine/homoserine/homoserine lactone efflux protein